MKTAIFTAAIVLYAPLAHFSSSMDLTKPFGQRESIANVASSAINRTGTNAPLFDDLGNHHHAITTSSDAAQRYFDQGLTLTYGFHHGEAIRSFEEVARLDPDCAMAYWGIAYALGPNINVPMRDEDVPKAWQALEKAKRRVIAQAKPVVDLI